MTDAGRTRWAMLGLVVVCLLLDYFLKYGILQAITERRNNAVIGLVLFGVVLLAARMIKGHRTFSHSLLFVFFTAECINLIYPAMTLYYLAGSLLHVFVDLFNNPVPGPNDDWNKKHGIWLLYPIKGKGISFGICKAGGIGNKILYFGGAISYLILTVIYCMSFNEGNEAMPIVIVSLYLLVVLHLVRKESEKELQNKRKNR